jgi:hypothetical protein
MPRPPTGGPQPRSRIFGDRIKHACFIAIEKLYAMLEELTDDAKRCGKLN